MTRQQQRGRSFHSEKLMHQETLTLWIELTNCIARSLLKLIELTQKTSTSATSSTSQGRRSIARRHRSPKVMPRQRPRHQAIASQFLMEQLFVCMAWRAKPSTMENQAKSKNGMWRKADIRYL